MLSVECLRALRSSLTRKTPGGLGFHVEDVPQHPKISSPRVNPRGRVKLHVEEVAVLTERLVLV